jgi:hypothetical protein
MRFSAAVVATTLAVVARAQDTTSAPEPTTAEVPTMTYSLDPVQSSIQSCISDCDAADVNCIAKCAPVPSPNDQQAIDTTGCITKCSKDILGNGEGGNTEDQVNKYVECSNQCVQDHYYNSDGTPEATGGNNNSSPGSEPSATVTETDTEAETTATVTTSGGSSETDGSETSSESEGASTTSSGDDAEETGGDDDSAASTIVGSTAAFFGLFAAVFAL